MLAELLKRYQSGEMRSQAEMAAQLGVTEELICMMTEELARKGFLEEVDQCRITCSACPENSGCSAAKTGRVWVLTQKSKPTS